MVAAPQPYHGSFGATAAAGATVSPGAAHGVGAQKRDIAVPRKMTGRMWAIVEGKLAMQWSPEQISGRLRLDEVVSVSAEWIYRHVWEDKRNRGDLYKHLRRRGKKRNARGSKYSGRGHIPGRVDISERPSAGEGSCGRLGGGHDRRFFGVDR